MLRTRLLTVAIIFPALLFVLFGLSASHWAALVLVAAAIAAYEWAKLSGLSVQTSLVYGLIVPAVAILIQKFGGVFASGAEITRTVCAVAVIFWVTIAPLLLSNRLTMTSKSTSLVVGAIVLIPVYFALASIRELGPLYVFFSMGVIWLADTAAYFAGRAFGRHKLAPTISPGKTWEGVAGALVVSVIYAVILVSLSEHYGAINDGKIGLVALAFVVLTAFSILGDLFESWLKRRSGAKDSGNLFPGHGGILDRIDSITSTMPFTALILSCCRAPLGL